MRVRVTGWAFSPSSWRGLPYMSCTAPRLSVDAGSSDAHGVAQHEVDGRVYDHPVAQARLVTTMIAGFRLTQDPRYVDRARANAQRLLDTGVECRDALYLPYRFRHRLMTDVLEPTWYSAMAQGLALSAMCRLHYVTQERAWLDAARRLFRSYLNPRTRRRPWTAHVDSCRHLWLEEYPTPARGEPMRVLNGHVFSAIGVYDYLWLTGDARAAVVLDAAATTVLEHGAEYRVPGACSYYSLTHPVAKPDYHSTHVWQLARLATWTGDERFAALSARFAADVPQEVRAPAPPARAAVRDAELPKAG